MRRYSQSVAAGARQPIRKTMAKDFSKAFYKSKQWQNCRDTYAKKKCYICEICGEPANEVHHKIILTPENINDPAVTTSFDNLMLLCWACHRRIHREQEKAGRYIIDSEGKVIVLSDL